ncbi:molybdenum cofactor biosynthesis protein MoaE [Sphingobacterium cellulitidis]|uniref:Molybdopterin synthase catalytic subunit n=1 Tax=Sphingobacterium cellulitidis TaxID=1768011 RepID=A0A8H9FXI4_9SPHI|nr:molybdenum cofactor biosynthesis protein MoaE [Sphingobacterium soli]MBA8986982.1 molybdopterin synthase catalytic subunit [Sphingobacterium soli]GGE15408.1 molybdopterin synthase catalytic subunit [Sphingobacterium soli]
MIELKISNQALDLLSCLEISKDLESGGVATFIGSVRNNTKGKEVVRLEFECYEPMAIKEMKKIAESAVAKFAVRNVVIHHRIGVLYPGDVAVIIVVNDGHRESVFDACRYIIDSLKETVPIWKREIFEDGAEWVAAHP